MNAIHTASHVTEFLSPVYTETQYVMHTACQPSVAVCIATAKVVRIRYSICTQKWTISQPGLLRDVKIEILTPYNASYSKLLLFEGFSAILV